MKAAVLHRHGEPPRMDDFDEPVEDNGHVVAHVTAAGVNHLHLATRPRGDRILGAPTPMDVLGIDVC